jgi:ariadne-1
VEETLAASIDGPRKKKSPDVVDAAALPATPVTNTSANMDSDDGFNSSQMSEDEFMEDQDSDIELDEGEDTGCQLVSLFR